jgi:predicted MPP superfamily phosphohydrolase
VIGPLLRSPRNVPRASAVVPGRRRWLENLATHWVERLTAPLGYWRRTPPAVERLDLGLAGLAPAFDGYRAVFLADLHYSAVVPRRFLARALATAMELEPDLILLGGDYLSHSARYAAGLTELLRSLAAPDGVLGVLGNHDHYVGAALVRAALRDAGVTELLNASVLVRRGTAELAVAGVGDLRFDAIDFRGAVAGIPRDVPRIVVSHDPDVFAYWPPELRCDVMLSGHTHGGQALLPLLGPPYVPSQFGFRYLAGLVEEGGRRLYVSRGIGVITAPIRWRCPPEITLLVLHPLDKNGP